MELKKINIFSLAKITTLFGLVAGIIISIVFAILKKIAASNLPEELVSQYPALQTIASFTIQSALLVILQYTIFGLVWGVVIALIYNLLARYFGGVKIELK